MRLRLLGIGGASIVLVTVKEARQGLGFTGRFANNRRLGSLRSIVSGFADLVAEKRGVVVAHVQSAHPLSDVQREQLRARLIEAGYGSVNIQESVEPGLSGDDPSNPRKLDCFGMGANSCRLADTLPQSG